MPLISLITLLLLKVFLHLKRSEMTMVGSRLYVNGETLTYGCKDAISNTRVGMKMPC